MIIENDMKIGYAVATPCAIIVVFNTTRIDLVKPMVV